jgi:hypothetical protein
LSTARLTSGKALRREWGRPWTERVPLELLVVGRAYRHAIRLLRAGKGSTHDPKVDWETLYRRPSWEVSRGILAVLLPGDVPRSTSVAELVNDEELDRWVRDFVRGITGARNHPESIAHAVVEQTGEHMKRKLPQLRIELRATLDHVAALAFYRAPLALLVEQAERGDLDALERLLHINAALESRPWIRKLMGDAVSSRGVQAIERFRTAVSQGLTIRQNKLLELGALLLLLWPWLGRLTTNQRRRFLKSLGVPDVPNKEALREHERWLGVKHLYAQWARED